MSKHKWAKAFVLAGLFALPSTVSMAAEVQMIVIPCLPGMRPDQCGVKISKEGSEDVTFTLLNGQTINVPAGTVVSVAGNGVVTQSALQGSLVNFASAETGLTTGSVGGGGGGGGAGGTPLPTGGSNTGAPPTPPTPTTTTTFTLTGGGAPGVSSSTSP